MADKDHVEMEGHVMHCGSGGIFIVETDNGHRIKARLSGRMRKNKIRVVIGDKVKVNVSAYDASQGILTFRER